TEKYQLARLSTTSPCTKTMRVGAPRGPSRWWCSRMPRAKVSGMEELRQYVGESARRLERQEVTTRELDEPRARHEPREPRADGPAARLGAVDGEQRTAKLGEGVVGNVVGCA